jgi:hypothetical protein
MIIKFIARTMQVYKGTDGNGNSLDLIKDQTAEVSETVGKLLCQKYHHNFIEVKDSASVEKPSKSDKRQRKLTTFQSK